MLNGVLMGLTLREARRRFDAVLDFAELEDFVDLKLKNYSSGMIVRLAFAVMVAGRRRHHARSTRCSLSATPPSRRSAWTSSARSAGAGKTIVLVTHDMATVQTLCDRAMLLHDGELRFLGDPEEAALRYYRVELRRPRRDRAAAAGRRARRQRAASARAARRRGERVENVEQGEPIELDLVLEARRDARCARSSPSTCVNEDGAPCSASPRTPRRAGRRRAARAARGRDREPRCCPAATSLDCWIARRPRRRASCRCRGCDCSTSSSTGRGRGTGVVLGARPTSSRCVERGDASDRRAARRPGSVRAGRRPAALARAALPDRRHRVQAAPTSARRSATCGRSRGR